MRTTLSIDDDVFEAARTIAEHTKRSMGAVVSELARRGLRPRAEARVSDSLPCFEVSEKARPFTPEMVRRDLDDGV